MFLTLPPTAQVDANLVAVFARYRETIFKIHTCQFNDEDIRGFSEEVYSVAMYYIAIYYVLFIWLEISSGYTIDWVTKYKVNENRKKLACCGIDLDDILADFGITTTEITSCIEGIGSMDIEECFQVEPTTIIPIVKTKVDIQHLVDNPTECFSYVN